MREVFLRDALDFVEDIKRFLLPCRHVDNHQHFIFVAGVDFDSGVGISDGRGVGRGDYDDMVGGIEKGLRGVANPRARIHDDIVKGFKYKAFVGKIVQNIEFVRVFENLLAAIPWDKVEILVNGDNDVIKIELAA